MMPEETPGRCSAPHPRGVQPPVVSGVVVLVVVVVVVVVVGSAAARLLQRRWGCLQSMERCVGPIPTSDTRLGAPWGLVGAK